MIEVNQMDIQDILGDLQNGPLLSTHRGRINAILRHFNTHGLTLAVAGDSRHLNRCTATMKAYSRELGLRWPDYIPIALMTDAERAEKRASKKKSP